MHVYVYFYIHILHKVQHCTLQIFKCKMTCVLDAAQVFKFFFCSLLLLPTQLSINEYYQSIFAWKWLNLCDQ